MELSLNVRFGLWLTAAGLLSDRELVQAEAHQRQSGERLPDAIVRLGHMNPEEMAEPVVSEYSAHL